MNGLGDSLTALNGKLRAPMKSGKKTSNDKAAEDVSFDFVVLDDKDGKDKWMCARKQHRKKEKDASRSDTKINGLEGKKGKGIDEHNEGGEGGDTRPSGDDNEMGMESDMDEGGDIGPESDCDKSDEMYVEHIDLEKSIHLIHQTPHRLPLCYIQRAMMRTRTIWKALST